MQFRVMDDTTFEDYMATSAVSYARDRMRTDRISEPDALRFVAEQRSAILTQGMNTPDHYFYGLFDEDRNVVVGRVWLYLSQKKHAAFLYDIVIFEDQRRKGYGQSAIAGLREMCKLYDVPQLWLNVFGHNESARSFYESLGFEVSALHLSLTV